MKQKYIIWLLSVGLSASAVANVLFAKASIGYFEDAYGAMAEQHLFNSQVRDQLEQGDLEAAKALLDREIEAKGSLLAICIMEGCSTPAKEVLHGYIQL